MARSLKSPRAPFCEIQAPYSLKYALLIPHFLQTKKDGYISTATGNLALRAAKHSAQREFFQVAISAHFDFFKRRYSSGR